MENNAQPSDLEQLETENRDLNFGYTVIGVDE